MDRKTDRMVETLFSMLFRKLINCLRSSLGRLKFKIYSYFFLEEP